MIFLYLLSNSSKDQDIFLANIIVYLFLTNKHVKVSKSDREIAE